MRRLGVFAWPPPKAGRVGCDPSAAGAGADYGAHLGCACGFGTARASAGLVEEEVAVPVEWHEPAQDDVLKIAVATSSDKHGLKVVAAGKFSGQGTTEV